MCTSLSGSEETLQEDFGFDGNDVIEERKEGVALFGRWTCCT